MKTLETMLGVINPVALPVLRIGGALFLVINLLWAVYVWRHRHRLFGRDRNVDNDIPVARHARIELLFFPWLALTIVLLIEWLRLWFG
jgi:hypothetical protein